MDDICSTLSAFSVFDATTLGKAAITGYFFSAGTVLSVQVLRIYQTFNMKFGWKACRPVWERLNCGGMGGPSWAPMGRPWVVGWVGGGGGDGGAEEFGADPANTWHGPSSCQDAVRSKKKGFIVYCPTFEKVSKKKIIPWPMSKPMFALSNVQVIFAKFEDS